MSWPRKKRVVSRPRKKRVLSRPRKQPVKSSRPKKKPSHQQQPKVRRKLHRPRAGKIGSRSAPLVHPNLPLGPPKNPQSPNRKRVGLQMHPRRNQFSRTGTVGLIVAGRILLHRTGETIRPRLVIPLREGPAALPARNVPVTLTTRKRPASGPAKTLSPIPLRHEPGLRPPSRGKTARDAEAKREAIVAGALLMIPLFLTEAPAGPQSRNRRMSPRQRRPAPLLRKALPPERSPGGKMDAPPVSKEPERLTTKRSPKSGQKAVLPGILPRGQVTRKHAPEEGIIRCLPGPASRMLTIITNPAQSHPLHQRVPPIRPHRSPCQILPSLRHRIQLLQYPLRLFQRRRTLPLPSLFRIRQCPRRRCPRRQSPPLPFPLQEWMILPNQPLQERLRQETQKSPKRAVVMTEVLIVQTILPPIPPAERTPKI